MNILKEAEAGVSLDELARQHSFSKASFYNWKGKHSRMSVSELKRLREFKEGNRRLKQMYMNLSLEHDALKEVIKKTLKGEERRELAKYVMEERVLINLVENSSKFTPTEGEIQVGAQHEDSWVHLWVKDTGPGIPPAEQERVFDKFTRMRGSNKPGLGIGLAFRRLAVQGHGGNIWIESDSGRGATFHFTFPVAATE